MVTLWEPPGISCLCVRTGLNPLAPTRLPALIGHSSAEAEQPRPCRPSPENSASPGEWAAPSVGAGPEARGAPLDWCGWLRAEVRCGVCSEKA